VKVQWTFISVLHHHSPYAYIRVNQKLAKQYLSFAADAGHADTAKLLEEQFGDRRYPPKDAGKHLETTVIVNSYSALS